MKLNTYVVTITYNCGTIIERMTRAMSREGAKDTVFNQPNTPRGNVESITVK